MSNQPSEHLFFHGDVEALQFSFIQIPSVLVSEPYFKGLSLEAKFLYGLLLSRQRLSITNKWFDDKNRVYIHYTREQVMEDFHIGKTKASSIFSELTKHHLIHKEKQIGSADRIYVLNFMEVLRLYKTNYFSYESSITMDIVLDVIDEASLPKEPEVLCDNYPEMLDLSRVSSDDRPREPRKTANANHSGSSVRTTEDRLCEPPLFASANPNNINSIHIEKNHINQSEATDGLIPSLDYTLEDVHELYDYDMVKADYPNQIHQYEYCLNIIFDILNTKKTMVRVGGEDKPVKIVKNRLLKLNCYEILYVLDKYESQTVKIKDPLAYILTQLYRAKEQYALDIRNDININEGYHSLT